MSTMSFAEMMATYGKDLPITVARSMRIGRKSRRNNWMTYEALRIMEEMSIRKGSNMRTTRDDMLRVLGVYPENLSRPLTIDEALILCDTLGIESENVLSELKKRSQKTGAPNQEEEN